jgi:hypothetical protein
MFGPRRDPRACPGLRPPKALDVFLGQDHRGIETDDRETSGDVEDRPDHLLSDRWVEEVELCRVVPGKARPIVPVIDVADVAGLAIEALEHDRSVGVVPVVVLQHDPDPIVG